MKRFGGKALGIAAIAVVLSVVLSGCFQNDLLQLARSISHNTFTLTVIASEGGTTTPSGAIEVTPSVPAPISATAASGYQFINWDGGGDAILYGDDYRGGLGVVQFNASY